MSCHGGTHFSCECQRELLENAVDALKELVNGIEDYKDSIAIIDRVKGDTLRVLSIAHRRQRPGFWRSRE